jgi:hypothetical protein
MTPAQWNEAAWQFFLRYGRVPDPAGLAALAEWETKNADKG